MLEYALYTVGGILILYWLISTLSVGFVNFTNILCVVGAVLVLLGIGEKYFGMYPVVQKMKAVLVPLVAVGILLFGVLEGVIISGAVQKDSQPADYILVLGAGLKKDRLSLTLLRRLDAALECEQGEVIVVSGGQGWNETIPEAEAMGHYLREQGIHSDRLIEENRSVNTMENLCFSKELIEAHSGKSVSDLKIKIVSSDYHSFRARLLAKRAGYQQVYSYGASTPVMAAPSGFIREAGALVKSFFLDR